MAQAQAIEELRRIAYRLFEWYYEIELRNFGVKGPCLQAKVGKPPVDIVVKDVLYTTDPPQDERLREKIRPITEEYARLAMTAINNALSALLYRRDVRCSSWSSLDSGCSTCTIYSSPLPGGYDVMLYYCTYRQTTKYGASKPCVSHFGVRIQLNQP
jgi:hypothetical protein